MTKFVPLLDVRCHPRDVAAGVPMRASGGDDRRWLSGIRFQDDRQRIEALLY